MDFNLNNLLQYEKESLFINIFDLRQVIIFWVLV